jgi:predicted house-cleaning NTP pyrophosphatase (Maf/HAM1 superfamily)
MSPYVLVDVAEITEGGKRVRGIDVFIVARSRGVKLQRVVSVNGWVYSQSTTVDTKNGVFGKIGDSKEAEAAIDKVRGTDGKMATCPCLLSVLNVTRRIEFVRCGQVLLEVVEQKRV